MLLVTILRSVCSMCMEVEVALMARQIPNLMGLVLVWHTGMRPVMMMNNKRRRAQVQQQRLLCLRLRWFKYCAVAER